MLNLGGADGSCKKDWDSCCKHPTHIVDNLTLRNYMNSARNAVFLFANLTQHVVKTRCGQPTNIDLNAHFPNIPYSPFIAYIAYGFQWKTQASIQMSYVLISCSAQSHA